MSDPVGQSSRLAQELQEQTLSESRLAAVLDTAVFPIIVMDEQARMLIFNKACERTFGYSAEEAIGRNVKMIMPPEEANRHDQYLLNYYATGEKKIIGIGRRVRGAHRDGTVIPVELAVGEAMTPDGRQFIGIMRDLRAEVEADERANALQTELIRFARINAMDEMGAALAHELNQPLTAVMLYLQAVNRAAKKQVEKGSLAPEITEILGKAVNEADRAGKIIQRMRRFIEKRETERQKVLLPDLVDETIEFAIVGARGHDVEIVRRHEDGLVPVEIDQVQIQQVLVNLMRNALEAVRVAVVKRILVETFRDEQWEKVSVTDSGAGVPPELVPDLFRAFSSRTKGGVGLGLAISRTIAQSHGGDLTVDPGGGGRGATFTLALPIERPLAPRHPTGRTGE
ncbi:two-component system sensor histidine kinase NtrB [Lutibaculum baratangense]|uniref:Sensor protein FixL n=1 Tax=Lutibaculum baratangense AMV1 TaxID=631454 RepID=V4RTM4_9HYPH|nr:PAS domain S-box protein [Lutibaculum baratangense]ESR26430.1 Two-component oxygen-sensor histidine kinase FixL [Lutibaculum baratangense AMV1]